MRNKKKGFTLIELLAVIVILAVITVIAVPKILNVIENSKRKSFESSANLIIESVKIKYASSTITNENVIGEYEFENGDYKEGSNKLNFKGDKPYSGKVVLRNDGKVALAIVSKDKKYCATKDYTEAEVKVKTIEDGMCMVNEDISAVVPENTKIVEFKLGDYVKMTPINTSYKVDTSKTGGSSSTINPSELNLWRVIKINEDGTVDMVSENVSSIKIDFSGENAYINLVEYLNEMAKQYENSEYTIGSRMMGWNPDTELVRNAIGTLVASTPNGTNSSYILAATYYYNNPNYGSDSAGAGGKENWNARTVDTKGNISALRLRFTLSDNKYYNAGGSISIRPIVILKSQISASGKGTSDSPYILK